MKRLQMIQGAAAGLATLGMVVPQGSAFAAPPRVEIRTGTAPVTTSPPNVALTAGGTLSGRVVDHTGKVIEGAQVSLRQGKKELAKTLTDKEGLYSFKGLKSGVYRISSGNTDGVFQVWSEKSAPPVAKEHALLVMGENGARGQFSACDPCLIVLTAGVIAAVVLSAITLSKVNEVAAHPYSP
jgi:Carboxypeptidase regulatory-like domain